MREISRVRIFCLGMVAASLSACAQPYDAKPNFFEDGYAESVQRSQPGVAANGRPVVTVAKGDTLYSIARRNDSSVQQLASVNKLKSPYALAVGQRIVLPGKVTAEATAPRERVNERVHVVRRSETLYRIAVNNNTSVATLSALNGISAPYALAVGQQVKLPATGAHSSEIQTATGAIAPPPGQVNRTSTNTARRVAPPPKSKKVATARPSNERRLPLSAPPRRSSNSKFIWPVEGRVISRFGGKATGLRNDGINIKTDAGAPVRAANAGIVTYAGNELRGYGNLLLVKHDDGYITAYAHNSELLVKKGARVNKGQVIASVGQTGSVTEPQLHFEIRRGAKAINPEKYLGK